MECAGWRRRRVKAQGCKDTLLQSKLLSQLTPCVLCAILCSDPSPDRKASQRPEGWWIWRGKDPWFSSDSHLTFRNQLKTWQADVCVSTFLGRDTMLHTTFLKPLITPIAGATDLSEYPLFSRVLFVFSPVFRATVEGSVAENTWV